MRDDSALFIGDESFRGIAETNQMPMFAECEQFRSLAGSQYPDANRIRPRFFSNDYVGTPIDDRLDLLVSASSQLLRLG